MKIASLGSGLVLAASIAAACGSSDKSIAVRAGGAGGEAGASSPPVIAGGSTDTGAAGAEPSRGGAAGEGHAVGGGANAPGGAAGAGLGGGEAGGEGGAGDGAGPIATVVDWGFEDSAELPPNLDPGAALLTPSQGFGPLGPIGNQFGDTFLRGPTGTVITLTLTDLPPHETLSLSLLFAAIDSLDGEGVFPAGDYFKITLDDQVIFRESFANAIESQIQSYDPPAEVVLARRQDLGFQGPGGYYTDSAYNFGLDPAFSGIPHTASTAVLLFTLEGEGVQSLDDESWAIDNVRVTVQ